jgi:sec-independent protein translocase protein TatC
MTNSSKSPDNQQHAMPFIEHLIELRNRLLNIVVVVMLVFLALSPLANNLFTMLAEPLQRFLPAGTQMIAIDVASPFFTPFKLTLVLAIFIAIPHILHQFWSFIAPGLYKHEQSLILPLLVSSTLLFYLGMAFAYYVVFPLVFGFMVSMTPDGVAMMTDISRYLDFVLKMFFAFGIAFEVPVITVVFVWLEMITPEALASKRPHIIVGAFIIGMLMTPPDVISQTLLAIPMWLLFEIGLFFSRIALAKKKARETQQTTSTMEKPLTLDEMDAELTRIEAEEDDKKSK